MIKRDITPILLEVSNYFPVITVTGPRQSGKTTLIKTTFPNLPYALLETPQVKALATEDPKGFLAKYPNGAILDEVQNVPELFSYIQGIVDDNEDIKFILSGSQNFLLLEKVNQTLAGRVAVLNLLPFTLNELNKGGFQPTSGMGFILKGGYPRLFRKKIPPHIYYSNYIKTYLERDVRTVKNIGDLNTFKTFMELCAGRTGQILNIDSLASDAGVALNTAKSWLSILEASFILYQLRPHHKNYNKRLIKRPKLYFYDTGVACFLLNIQSSKQLESHFLRGALFENMVINQLTKFALNKAKNPSLYFWRNNHGKEIDCLIDRGEKLIPIEIKSGKTYTKDFFKGLNYWNKLSGNSLESSFVVYGGNESQKLPNGNLLTWDMLDEIYGLME
jgi:predicted AAA+ superfamily ATPase